MDPITHLSSGLMGGLAGQKWFPKARFFIPACLLASWIPDGDILFGNGDPELHLLYHRGLTTSFFGTLFLSLAVAGLFKLVSRSTPFIKAWALFYALALTHVWLDLITTYGTQLLAPFSNHRFALNGSFIIDPVFTLSAIAICVLAWRRKNQRHAIALFGMAWFFLYPIGNMAMGTYLEATYARRLTDQGITFEDVQVTPDALSPRYWKVVTTNGQDYRLDTIDLFGSDELIKPLHFQRANKDDINKLGEQESMFATYAWFSKWPYVVEETDADGRTLIFHDLRFISTNPVLIRVFGDRELPFTLTARLNNTGQILNWKFNGGVSSGGDTLEKLP